MANKRTFSRLGVRAGQLGRQYTPVDVTPQNTQPSKRGSRASIACQHWSESKITSGTVPHSDADVSRESDLTDPGFITCLKSSRITDRAILGGVNRAHHWYCAREAWKRHVREDLVPQALSGLELGDAVLEVGPGFGPATDVLAGMADRLTVLEIDQGLASALRRRLGDRVDVVHGDATAMPFSDGEFSAAACFTMLHHIPSVDAQDRLFGEVHRVLRPGAPFAGTDSTGRGIGFALLHLGDIRVVIDPDDLPARLQAAGFEDVTVDVGPDAFRFRARRAHL